MLPIWHEEIGGVVVCGAPLGDTQIQPYLEEQQENKMLFLNPSKER